MLPLRGMAGCDCSSRSEELAFFLLSLSRAIRVGSDQVGANREELGESRRARYSSASSEALKRPSFARAFRGRGMFALSSWPTYKMGVFARRFGGT